MFSNSLQVILALHSLESHRHHFCRLIVHRLSSLPTCYIFAHPIDTNLNTTVMTRFTAIHASKPKAARSAGPSISQNVRGEPLIDFHVFADLAAEIQDAIWECVSHPCSPSTSFADWRQSRAIRPLRLSPYSSTTKPSNSRSRVSQLSQPSFTRLLVHVR